VAAPAQFRTPNIQLIKVQTHDSNHATLVDFSQYCFTDFREPYYLSIPASDRPMNFGSVHKIDDGLMNESDLYIHLRSMGMFEGEPPSQQILDHFSFLDPEIHMSKIVSFAHELGCQYELEGTTLSDTDCQIRRFVDRVFPKAITGDLRRNA
jgi:hypothetical protein